MKKLLIILTSLLLISSVSIAQKWKVYKYKESNSKISFIDEPTEKINQSDERTTHSYMVNKENIVYLYSYTVHETEMMDHFEMAVVGLEAFAERLKGETVSEEDFMVKGNKGRSATIKVGESLCYYKTILIDQIQYQVAFIGPADDQEIIKQGKKFMKSFKVKK